jgi:hypothetical protein
MRHLLFIFLQTHCRRKAPPGCRSSPMQGACSSVSSGFERYGRNIHLIGTDKNSAKKKAMNLPEKKILDAVQREWSWAIGRPQKIFKWNRFGNVIVLDSYDEYHRIIPENLEAVKLGNEKELYEKFNNEEFLVDWRMDKLVHVARENLGELSENECYGFKIWPIFRDAGYGVENLMRKNMAEWISVSGSMGKQIKDLPDGTDVQIVIGKKPE